MQQQNCRQKGVALITAILITAMVSIAAVAMTARQALDIRRTANILHSDQAYLYAVGVEVFAKTGLVYDVEPNVDHREEDWANQAFATPIEGGTIAGSMIDLNGTFPINRLIKTDGTIDRDYLEAFKRLLDALDFKNPGVATAVADWLDKDDTVEPNGAEDSDYLGLEKPHRTGNTEMASLSELRVILGFYKDEKGKEKDLDLLLPPGKEAFVNVLPNGTNPIMINVNTAPVEVLMSLHPLITDTVAEKIVAARSGQTPNLFENKDKIAKEIASADFADLSGTIVPPARISPAAKFEDELNKLGLDIKSEYFEVTAVAQIGTSELTVKSLLQRPDNAITAKNPQLVKTIRRGIGDY